MFMFFAPFLNYSRSLGRRLESLQNETLAFEHIRDSSETLKVGFYNIKHRILYGLDK